MAQARCPSLFFTKKGTTSVYPLHTGAILNAGLAGCPNLVEAVPSCARTKDEGFGLGEEACGRCLEEYLAYYQN